MSVPLGEIARGPNVGVGGSLFCGSWWPRRGILSTPAGLGVDGGRFVLPERE